MFVLGLWCFKVQNLPLERGLPVQTWTSNRKPDGKGLVTWLLDLRDSQETPKNLNLMVSIILEYWFMIVRTVIQKLIYRERILHGGAKIWILFSSSKTIFYERAQRVSKILFLPRGNKIHIFKPPCKCSFYYINKMTSIKIIEGNYENYVIDKLRCEIMENKQLGSRM